MFSIKVLLLRRERHKMVPLVWSWVALLRSRQGTLNFLNGIPHFSVHIPVAYLESSSKHYNKVFFH